MSNLDPLTKQISVLAAALAAAGKTKSPVLQAEELNRALKSAKCVDWSKLTEAIEVELEVSKSEADRCLTERRQRMLEVIKAKGSHYRSEADFDAVDVFKIRYKGPITIIEFAGVEVDTSDELDGSKLADTIFAIRSRLEKASMDRTRFFRLVQAAITHANAKNPSRDGYINVASIYREMLFEQAWTKSSFARSGAAKHFPDYPFYQFLWDLASFVSGGSIEGQWRLDGRTPAMSERAESYALPDVNNPQAPATVLHVLRVKPTES